MFTLPSGQIYCNVDGTIQLPFNEADQYCKDIGLDGLAEPVDDADLTNMAGLIVCK